MKTISFSSSKICKLLFCSLVILFSSCSSEDSKDGNESENPDTVSDALHLAFKTPDWEEYINCEQLDLFPQSINESTSYVSASSASTRETFFFSYPSDSSKIVKAEILSKHKIMEFGSNDEPFQFSQKLPLDRNSIDDTTKRLVSSEGLSTNEYNQLVEVKYLKSEKDYAVFRVKCKYEMTTYLVNSPETTKKVTGTFAFKIRTSKD
ncbi:hypothetical protein GON26_17540 [Flavobacterium sp. GA093]|uniref:Lipoprotein n=1 Tax=Flavobacterium hydrocarbonoxydans TaxID=2683249 RepID=A0A6I4NWU2_9FLAO|nr:hypothetical protein [Flavobacterium hydrocarbonoxydans]MWB96169.1 hypothetical protein [Flavobacterium hydrocarbonoxydans]